MTPAGSDPEISVVIPCYNTERWVARAIDSALAQEGVRVEVIVIDDGSTDGSLEVIRGYDGRIRWETGPNRGVSAARNRGLALAAAPYVLFLDADDYLEGPFLASGVDTIASRKCDIALGAMTIENCGARTKNQPFLMGADIQAVFRYFFDECFLAPCAIVWQKNFLSKIGGWDSYWKISEDYELILRAFKFHPKIATFKGGSGVYFQHSSPGRVSAGIGLKKVRQKIELDIHLVNAMRAIGLQCSEITHRQIFTVYNLLRHVAKNDENECFEDVLAYYRSIGGSRHYGSRFHILACRILGLRRKERLALKLHAALSRFRTMRA